MTGDSRPTESDDATAMPARDAGATVIPVLREELRLERKPVELPRGLRLHRRVTERTETVDAQLRRESPRMERHPVGRLVDEPLPGVREEDGVVIVPVYEEVLVVTRRWRLREEVRIHRDAQTVREEPCTVVLRSEHVEVERFDDSSPESAAVKGEMPSGKGDLS